MTLITKAVGNLILYYIDIKKQLSSNLHSVELVQKNKGKLALQKHVLTI